MIRKWKGLSNGARRRIGTSVQLRGEYKRARNLAMELSRKLGSITNSTCARVAAALALPPVDSVRFCFTSPLISDRFPYRIPGTTARRCSRYTCSYPVFSPLLSHPRGLCPPSASDNVRENRGFSELSLSMISGAAAGRMVGRNRARWLRKARWLRLPARVLFYSSFVVAGCYLADASAVNSIRLIGPDSHFYFVIFPKLVRENDRVPSILAPVYQPVYQPLPSRFLQILKKKRKRIFLQILKNGRMPPFHFIKLLNNLRPASSL